MQNRTQSTNPWFDQVYPTGCSVGQANLDGPYDAKYLFELYSMTLHTFSYVVPASGNLLSKG
jgi:hypothetical protein